MSDCEWTFEQLSAHADGELAGGKAEDLADHLERCAACRSRLESVKATKHQVATLGARREPTDAVRRQIEREAAEQGAGEPPWYRRRQVWQRAALGVLAVGLMVVGYMLGMARSSELPDDWAETFVADHMHSKPAAKPMDVAGDKPEELVAFFEGRVGFEPVVPELPDVELVGGRLCKLAGHHVELLFYRHRDQILSLFVTDKLDVSSTCRQSDDHGVCVRKAGDLRYMLVGRLPPVTLRHILEKGRMASVAGRR